MARRKRSLLDELSEGPWWAGVLLGALGYAALAYIVPAIEFDNPLLGAITKNLPHIAPIWLVICLGGAALSVLRDWQRRRLHSVQRRSPDLNALSWREFERFVGEHFRRQGFAVIERGGAHPDGGVDLVVRKETETYLVQCKHWKARQVSVSVVRELVGSITHEGAAGAFLVTSGGVTTAATGLAHDSGITIVDGRRLVAELRDGNAVDTSADAAPDRLDSVVLCPRCRNPMRLRTARRGANAGNRFWGCARFPRCRGTKPAGDPA